MASEIRVDKINSLSGVGTVTLSPTGVDIAGITTAATLRATTGIVTSLTAGSLTSLGAVSGTTGTFSGAVSGTTGTFTGDVDIASSLVHTGDTDTKLTFTTDNISLVTGGTTRVNITSGGNLEMPNDNDYIKIGAGQDLQLVHTGSSSNIVNTTGALQIQSDDIRFDNASGTERARISATQFSVGTTAAVGGVNVAIAGSMRLVNATGQSATISALPSGTYNTGVSGGSAIVFHRFSDSGGGSDEIAFETHHQGTRHGEAARFNKSGNLAFPSGQGIDFTATGDGGTVGSELLDDYEEGTWVPNIYNAGSSSNWTAKDGDYQKVGNTVTVWFRCDGGTQPRSGGSSGHLTITGLPFALSGMDSNTILGIGGGNFTSSGSIDVNISTAGSGNPFVRRGGSNYSEQCNYFSACFTYKTTA